MKTEEEYEKAVKFLDGRDLDKIPREEVLEYARLPSGQVSNQAIVRLACFYEIWRYRNDPAYVRGIRTMYPEGRSFRRFWYDLVKPFLSRIEEAAQVQTPKWGRYRSQTLSAVLSEMVLEGFVRYGDINIMDVGEYARPKERPGSWNKLKVGRFDEVLVFVEKVAEFPTIRPLAELLGFTCECGKGQQATSAIDSLIDYLDPTKSYLVFCLVDFDYWGEVIFNSLEERSHRLSIDAEFVKVGITPDQVPQDVIETKKYYLPLENAKEKAWAEQNAIEGVYGLELEALNPMELRALIADAVYDHCDVKDLYQFLKDQALEGIPGEVAGDLADEDDDVKDLQDRISELEDELEALKNELIEKLKPRAEEILNENIDDLDQRKPFPWEWLRERIIRGETYLSHADYTSPYSIQERLKEMVRRG